jgi:hypothetical protein
MLVNPSRTELKPVVRDTSTVSRQVLECVQPIEVVDRYLCHGFRFRETQVDGNATPPVLILLLRAPEGYAAASGTEVELKRLTSNI